MELNSQRAGQREERAADNEKTFTRLPVFTIIPCPRGPARKHVRRQPSRQRRVLDRLSISQRADVCFSPPTAASSDSSATCFLVLASNRVSGPATAVSEVSQTDTPPGTAGIMKNAFSACFLPRMSSDGTASLCQHAFRLMATSAVHLNAGVFLTTHKPHRSGSRLVSCFFSNGNLAFDEAFMMRIYADIYRDIY